MFSILMEMSSVLRPFDPKEAVSGFYRILPSFTEFYRVLPIGDR